MPNLILSSGIAAQLLSFGISASKHNLEDLREMILPFDGLEGHDIELLAEIVVYLGRHNLLSVETSSWKSLPWGTHACLFYKFSAELVEPFKKNQGRPASE